MAETKTFKIEMTWGLANDAEYEEIEAESEEEALEIAWGIATARVEVWVKDDD